MINHTFSWLGFILVTGGRNGYGAKLCNIFSTKFVVETQTNDNQKAFKQVRCILLAHC